MKQICLVNGRSPAEFAQKYNDSIANLSGTIISEKFISDTTAFLFYEVDEADHVEEIRQRAEQSFKRSMKECSVDVGQNDESFETDVIEIRIKAGRPIDRHCCECGNYSWSQRCPYREGPVARLEDACGMFNVIIERR